MAYDCSEGLDAPQRLLKQGEAFLVRLRFPILFGEIDARLDGRHALHNLIDKRLDAAVDAAPKLPEGSANGLCALGAQQIHDRLGRGKIQSAALKRAPREFARLRGAKRHVKAGKQVQHGVYHRGRTVAVQLGHILAGICAGPG